MGRFETCKRWLCLAVAVGMAACEEEEADPTDEDAGALDAGGADAGRDAAAPVDASGDARVATDIDASTDASIDAAVDASVVSDAAQSEDGGATSACPLAYGFEYFLVGGFVQYETTYAVSAAGMFQRVTKDLLDMDAGLASCAATLPACGSESVDGADLTEALTAPDVEAAFTTDESVVLGEDQRPVDGSVLVVQRGDGKRITIGNACPSGQSGCTPVPAGVQSLSDLLFNLSLQQAAIPGPCFKIGI